ncbi:uncharacterized protein [Antedon mediterranea]|uniref:uncharacterized protein n=1 Tax=Antedon mediterranea TaxID=105859 RepID=UPI003AF4E6EF
MSNRSTCSSRRSSKLSSRSSNHRASVLADAAAAETEAMAAVEIASKEAELHILKARSKAQALRAQADTLTAVLNEDLHELLTTSPNETSEDHVKKFLADTTMTDINLTESSPEPVTRTVTVPVSESVVATTSSASIINRTEIQNAARPKVCTQQTYAVNSMMNQYTPIQTISPHGVANTKPTFTMVTDVMSTRPWMSSFTSNAQSTIPHMPVPMNDVQNITQHQMHAVTTSNVRNTGLCTDIPVLNSTASSFNPSPGVPAYQPTYQPTTQSINPVFGISRVWDGLPKLNIPKFCDEHDVKQYVTFKSVWDSVMSQAKLQLPEATKFAYLRSHLGGRPLAMADRNLMLGDDAYKETMKQLEKAFGDPSRIVQGLLDQLQVRPTIHQGDWAGLRDFSDELVTVVQTANKLNHGNELNHHRYAADLTKKLPDRLHDEFLFKMWKQEKGMIYTVQNLSTWLEEKTGPAGLILLEKMSHGTGDQKPYATAKQQKKREQPPATKAYITQSSSKAKKRVTCLYCDVDESGHYLETCGNFSKISYADKIKWLETTNRCKKCAKKHDGVCPFPKRCKECKKDHRSSLHKVIAPAPAPAPVEPVPNPTQLCTGMGLTAKLDYHDVLIKVVPLTIYGAKGLVNTYGVLDECAERTMVSERLINELGINGEEESIKVKTVTGDTDWKGKCVDFTLSPREEPDQTFNIKCAFAATKVQLGDYTVSAERLQSKWPHLRGLPLFTAEKVQPTILIGADNIECTLSLETRRGPKTGSPVAVKTLFGWTVQGKQGLQKQGKLLGHPQMMLTSTQPEHKLHQLMERFMAVDVLHHVNPKESVRSKNDKFAIQTLENGTKQVEVQGVQRLQTPLLWKPGYRTPSSTPRCVQSLALSTQRKISRKPELVDFCRSYINKLKTNGSIRVIGPVDTLSPEQQLGWYIPCHVVHSSGKYRLVFNCSFEYDGQNLNDELLAGPTLSPALLDVLLRFRQGRVGVSGDITAMFHQVKLTPEDRRMLRFLWWDDEMDTWLVMEWLVLPFGAACSPCCATFALQKVANDRKDRYPIVKDTIENETYVDNQLASRNTISEAKELVDKTRECLNEAGFQMVKYASSHLDVVEHLPTDVQSGHQLQSLSLSQINGEPEPALGLYWDCHSDELYHPAKSPDNRKLTKRNALRVLASQFEPLGDIAPFTSRAKTIVQELWSTKLDWDEEVKDPDIRQRWEEWCDELEKVPSIRIQRCYTPSNMSSTIVKRTLHVFCDASEKLYGAVAYLRSMDSDGSVHMSFVLAKCRVAPKRLTSIPRLELLGALLGAQLAQTITNALTLDVEHINMWSDSTTVLTWIQSDSCRFKVFVGTRIAEIQTLTSDSVWRYVRTDENPADDITRGLSVTELGKGSRWTDGPSWLLEAEDTWQSHSASVLARTRVSSLNSSVDTNEIKKSLFCGVTLATPVQNIDLEEFPTWPELVQALGEKLNAVDGQDSVVLTAEQVCDAEYQLLQRAQQESFKEEIATLKTQKEIPKSSRLLELSPELDETTNLIRVGGRLRKMDNKTSVEPHPIVLPSSHPVTKLLIQDADNHFSHQAGTEQVFAYLRRRFWILRGRTSVKGILRKCSDCKRWRQKPLIPRMADLPESRLRVNKPPFYSTGMDCFGPIAVKVRRSQEKRWGLVFKCMTTRAVHLELLESLDVDHFLMAYRRFASRRGVPYELRSDCGTNFKGAEKEIETALKAMEPELTSRLAKFKVRFCFNPPSAPHFGGLWEREVRSIKCALKGVLRDRVVPDVVLRTVLTEVEGIMNSKPLGYASSEIADIDPVTPNMLLMGRRDPALPMVVYDESELKRRRNWRHSQVLADQFWRQFIRSYLPTLQRRQKWQKEVENLEVGDVVMIVDPQLSRSQWPVGVVSALYPSSDNRVRVVDVRVNKKAYRRPVAKLVKLMKCDDQVEESSP